MESMLRHEEYKGCKDLYLHFILDGRIYDQGAIKWMILSHPLLRVSEWWRVLQGKEEEYG